MNLKPLTAPLVQTALSAALLLAAVSANAQELRTSGQQTNGVAAGVTLPNRNIYALTSDNAIYVLKPGASNYVRLGRADFSDGGNLIGIDFRPADATPTRMYGLTDKGNLYTIDVSNNNFGSTNFISTMNPRFTGGHGAIVDFNPVLNALRVTGTNDQNLAVLNGADGSNLTQTVAQTTFAYAQGDVNFGKDPELTGGAYTNNFAGSTATLFYLVDHDKDTLVTISTKSATGSSNTGGGQLQTIGKFVDENRQPLNMSPTTDFDIYTDSNGTNFLVGQTTRLIFSIDLSQIDPNLPLGKTQQIVVKRGRSAALPGSNAPLTGGVFDIAIPTR
ncbi:MAG: DUF4394 domain-containing protein [Steroidobacteraceae bacterium]